MRDRRLIIISIICGVICALCVFGYSLSVRAEAEASHAETLARYGGEQVEVVVATRDIAAGETVDAGSVSTKMWIADLLPADSVRNLSDVIGRQLTSSILAGEVVSMQRFQEINTAIEVPTGMVAVSVPAKDVQAVGGALVPGSYVNIYSVGDSSTKCIGRKVLVLATSASARAGSGSGTGDGTISWITLAVKPESAEETVAAAQKTQLYFTLPSDESTQSSTTDTEATK